MKGNLAELQAGKERVRQSEELLKQVQTQRRKAAETSASLEASLQCINRELRVLSF